MLNETWQTRTESWAYDVGTVRIESAEACSGTCAFIQVCSKVINLKLRIPLGIQVHNFATIGKYAIQQL